MTLHTTVEHVKGTSTDFFKIIQSCFLPVAVPLAIASLSSWVNPGFGSGNAPLVASWTKDLFLAEKRVPVIFTQANDYLTFAGS